MNREDFRVVVLPHRKPPTGGSELAVGDFHNARVSIHAGAPSVFRFDCHTLRPIELIQLGAGGDGLSTAGIHHISNGVAEVQVTSAVPLSPNGRWARVTQP